MCLLSGVWPVITTLPRFVYGSGNKQCLCFIQTEIKVSWCFFFLLNGRALRTVNTIIEPGCIEGGEYLSPASECASLSEAQNSDFYLIATSTSVVISMHSL